MKAEDFIKTLKATDKKTFEMLLGNPKNSASFKGISDQLLSLIEQNRFDKISKNGITLIAERFRELEKLCDECSRENNLQKLTDQAQDLGLGYD